MTIDAVGSDAVVLGDAYSNQEDTQTKENKSIGGKASVQSSFSYHQERLRTKTIYNSSMQTFANKQKQELFDVILKYENINGAVKAGDKRAIEIMLKNGMSILDSINNTRSYPFEIAMLFGNLDMALFLLEKDHPVENTSSVNGWLVEPIFLAIYYCAKDRENIKLVEKLLDNGANPNRVAGRGNHSLIADSILCQVGLSPRDLGNCSPVKYTLRIINDSNVKRIAPHLIEIFQEVLRLLLEKGGRP